MKSKADIIIFDVDDTLLTCDSLITLAYIYNSKTASLLLWIKFLPWLGLNQLGLVKTWKIKEKFLVYFILNYKIKKPNIIDFIETNFLEHLIKKLRPIALDRLKYHQAKGDRVILCSASPRFIIQPLADYLGVELIATEVVEQDGVLLPKLASPNCKGPEKVRRLEAYLGSLDGVFIEAYGDSKGDRELLQRADIPHYRSFDPTPRPYPAFDLAPLLPIVALALLGYGLAGFWSQGDQLLPLLAQVWPMILAGLGLVLVGYGLRFYRWRLLLQALGYAPPWFVDARIWMGSYAFTATPGKAGEAVRSVLLKQECQIPAPPTLMALVVERITDGTAVLLLLLINFPQVLRWQIPIFIPVMLVIIGLVFLAWVLQQRGCRRFLKQMALKLLPKKLAGASSDGIFALKQLLVPRVLLVATVIGALAWSLEGISLGLLLQAMGLNSVNWGGAILAHTAAGLVGALSMLPGGLGSTEAGTIGLLSLQGVSVSVATPATLLIRLMTLWFATVLGIICLLLPSPRPGKSHQQTKRD